MEGMNRRNFVRSTAILAAGTAAGGMIWKGIREHGLVEIRLFFFTNTPIVIEGDLLSDEARDLFRIRAFDKGQLVATAEIKLSAVKEIVAMPGKWVRMEMAMEGNGRTEKAFVNGIAEDGAFTFLVEEKHGNPSPVWLMLEDVKRVL